MAKAIVVANLAKPFVQKDFIILIFTIIAFIFIVINQILNSIISTLTILISTRVMEAIIIALRIKTIIIRKNQLISFTFAIN
jgi:hypothetical protein